MKDTVSVERVTMLHPLVRQEVINAIDAIECKLLPKNAKIRIVQGLRTIDEQNALYAQGRTKPGKIVTNAKGGSSFHNYGVAIDFAIMYDKDNDGIYEELSWDTNIDLDKNGQTEWKTVVDNFVALGWSWGGAWRTFKDLPHLEKTFKISWRDMFDKYNKKDFIPGTKYINIIAK